MEWLKFKQLMLFKKIIKNRGFGLIEVMIGGLILGISLLGIASMQSKALNMTTEADYNEVALRMINQLTSFALAADPSYVQYMADPGISMMNPSSIALCYNPSTPCDQPTFYKTLVLEWQQIVLTMFPNGRGCTCISVPATISTSSTGIPITLRLAIKWTNLYGVSSKANMDVYIPNAIIATPLPTSCPTAGGDICGFSS